MTTATAPSTPAPRSRTTTLTDRFLAAFPLATTYVLLLMLHGWQASKHSTPWVFVDEIKLTRISRGIAHHLHPVVMGDPSPLSSLAAVLTAPAWWLSSAGEGYAVAKWIGVAAMTATLFPAYGLARLVVGRWAALLAATGAVVVPALSYSVFLVEEPFAYPYSTLCLFLIARALVSRERRWIAAAVAASLFAPVVRDQLQVIPAIFALAAFWLAWHSEAWKARRAAWTRWDWVGLAVLLVGASVLFNAVMGRRDSAWLHATGFHKEWIFRYAASALGAEAIGLALFPLVATILAFWPGKGRLQRTEERVFAVLVASAGFCFVYYAGIKGAYIRESFSNVVVQRNVIYLAPLLLVGLAAFVERPRWDPIALAVAGATVLFIALHTPTLLDSHYYYEAPGVEILQAMNRWFSLTNTGARIVLLVLVFVSVELVVLVRMARPRVAQAAIAAMAVFVLGWSLTGEVAAAGSAVAHAQSLVRNMPEPRDWVMQATGGKPVVFLGANMNADPSMHDTLYEAEFWNPNIVRQWTIDGLDPPIPTQTPDSTPLGFLQDAEKEPIAPNVDYFLTTQDVDLNGEPIVTPDDPGNAVTLGNQGYVLWKVKHPVRLAHTVRGLTRDGWAVSPDGKQPARVSYSQFVTPGSERGQIAVTVARSAGCGKLPTERVVVRVGKLRVKDNLPVLRDVQATSRFKVDPCDTRTILMPRAGTLKAPFQVEVAISPTYRPRDYDARTSESRWLGAQVGFDFIGL